MPSYLVQPLLDGLTLTNAATVGVGVLSAYPGLRLRLAMSISVGLVQPLLLKLVGFSRLLALGESSLETCASSMLAPLAHVSGGYL